MSIKFYQVDVGEQFVNEQGVVCKKIDHDRAIVVETGTPVDVNQDDEIALYYS